MEIASLNSVICIIIQARQPFVPLYNNDQNIHVSSVPPHTYQYNPNQAQVNPPVQIPASYNVQGTQNNPCSGVMSFFASMPAYLFGGTTGTQLSAINVSVQAIPVNQQHLVTDPDRNASQAPVTSTVGTGQRPTFNTWEKVQLIVCFYYFYMYFVESYLLVSISKKKYIRAAFFAISLLPSHNT